MDKPQSVFRFEGFTTQSLLNLKSQAVYFGSPTQFNDPYDCALTSTVRFPDKVETSELVKELLEKDDVPNEVKAALRKESLEVTQKSFFDGVTEYQKEYERELAEKHGACCFSEANRDLLMWSHYAESGTGFCLEFSTDCEPFNKIRKVKYSMKMPRVNALDLVRGTADEAVLDLFCTKSTSWSYEREWRAFHKQAGTLFTYPQKALVAVYFGPDMKRQATEIICLILKGQNPDVELWKAHRNPYQFRVDFERVDYTAFVDIPK